MSITCVVVLKFCGSVGGIGQCSVSAVLIWLKKQSADTFGLGQEKMGIEIIDTRVL